MASRADLIPPLPVSPRVLVGVTGSIAATRLPEYLDALRAAFGGRYTVVMSRASHDFVPAPVLRLHADHVVADEDPDRWPTDRPSRLAADHDAIVVLPATAHVLASVAGGAAPNRLCTVILSAPRPAVFVPHMGPHMWTAPATRRNVTTLRADGHHVVEPVWPESRDVVTGELVGHPAVPEPAALVDALRAVYGDAPPDPTLATTSDSGGEVRSTTST